MEVAGTLKGGSVFFRTEKLKLAVEVSLETPCLIGKYTNQTLVPWVDRG